MRYLLLIYTREEDDMTAGEEERQEVMQEYFAFSSKARQEGVMLGGDELQPTTTATTVRVRDGQTLIADGPFAETKEQLGGYFVFQCDNLDDALEWAAQIPGARYGSIEVRPLVEYE